MNITGGTLAGSPTVNAPVTLSSGTLAGTPTIVGNVSATGGAISPAGAGTIGTLAVTGNLNLGSGSSLSYDLGAAGSSDLINVSGTGAGNVTLGGTLNLSAVTGFTQGGIYTLMNYTGTLGGSLAVGTVPTGYTAKIFTSTPDQVNLSLSASCTWVQITQTNGESGAPPTPGTAPPTGASAAPPA